MKFALVDNAEYFGENFNFVIPAKGWNEFKLYRRYPYLVKFVQEAPYTKYTDHIPRFHDARSIILELMTRLSSITKPTNPATALADAQRKMESLLSKPKK